MPRPHKTEKTDPYIALSYAVIAQAVRDLPRRRRYSKGETFDEWLRSEQGLFWLENAGIAAAGDFADYVLKRLDAEDVA